MNKSRRTYKWVTAHTCTQRCSAFILMTSHGAHIKEYDNLEHLHHRCAPWLTHFVRKIFLGRNVCSVTHLFFGRVTLHIQRSMTIWGTFVHRDSFIFGRNLCNVTLLFLEHVPWHIWMSHVAHMNKSRRTCKRVTAHTCTNRCSRLAYGVATISRLLKIIGLFCERAL